MKSTLRKIALFTSFALLLSGFSVFSPVVHYAQAATSGPVELDIRQPAVTDFDKEALKRQIVWADFANAKNVDIINGRKMLKVGSVITMNPTKGYVVTATVKALKPFRATDLFKERLDADPNATAADKAFYDPNAQNDGRIVVEPQSTRWSNMARSGFAVPGLVTLASADNGKQTGVVFDLKATYFGTPVKPAVVYADGEEANPGEFTAAITNGTPWEMLANVGQNIDSKPPSVVPAWRHAARWSALNGKIKYMVDPKANKTEAEAPNGQWTREKVGDAGLGTKFFGGINNSIGRNESTPIVISKEASEVQLFFNARGKQASMFGFVVMDEGDAEKSFGTAQHLMKVDQGQVGQPYVGSEKADMDLGLPGKDWVRDDDRGADEGVVQLMGDAVQNDTSGNQKHYPQRLASKNTYELPLKVALDGNKKAFVRGWVDFNNNGKFDDDERSELLTVTKDGKAELNFNNIPQTVNTKIERIGMRVRVSLSEGHVERPTGYSFSGEVEDFKINVVHPPRGKVKETTDIQGQVQKASFVADSGFKAFGRLDYGFAGQTENKMDISAEHPVKIVTPAGNLVDEYTETGIGHYAVDALGNVVFTPEKSWDGKKKAKGVVLRATDKNGRNTGWTLEEETDDLKNVNDGETVGYLIAGKKTMDAVYVPHVIPVVPTTSDKTSSGLQGQPQSAKPEFTEGDARVPMKPETLAFDTDENGNLVGQPAGATVSADGKTLTVPGEGTYTIKDDGTIEFQPDPSFTGTAKPIAVSMKDANGTKAVAKYTPTVTPVTPTADNHVTTGEQGQTQEATVNFTAGDATAPFTGGLSTPPMLIDPATGKETKTVTIPGEGTYTVDDNGKVTFTPDPQFGAGGEPTKGTKLKVVRRDKNGTLAEGSYQAIVTPVTPAGNDVKSIGLQGQKQSEEPKFESGSGNVPMDKTTLAFDTDENGNLVGQPAGATVSADGKTLTVPGEGTYKIEDDGTVSFQPEPQFTGEAKPITLSMKDTNGTKATAKYHPEVLAVTPTAVAKNTSGVQGQPQSGAPTFTAGDDKVPMADPATNPAKLVDKDGNKVDSITIPGEGTYTVAPDGTVTFKPDPQFTGEGTGVTVVRQDVNGTEAQAKYTPTVTAVNPSGADATTIGLQGQAQNGKPVFKGGDPLVPMADPADKPAKLKDPKTGKEVDSVTIPGEGTYTVAPDGTVTFQPDPQFTGEGTGVTVVREDVNGTKAEANYKPVVKAVTPTADPETTTGKQGLAQKGKVEFFPGDEAEKLGMDDTVPAQIVDKDGNPVQGVTTDKDGNQVLVVPGEGKYIVAPDGSVTFEPEPQFVGEAQGIFVQRVDLNGTPAQGKYTPTVEAVNPVAKDTSSGGVQGQEQSGKPEFTGGDPEVPMADNVPAKLIDPVTGNEVDSVTIPGEGTYTVAPDGTVTFQPEPQFAGKGTGVTVVRQDVNGTKAQAKYVPNVASVTPTVDLVKSIGKQGQPQSATPEFKSGDKAVDMTVSADNPAYFVDDKGNKIADTTIPALDKDGKQVGTYSIDPATGKVTFQPNKDFVGAPVPAKIGAKDANGTEAVATYSPVVEAVHPITKPAQSVGKLGETQTGKPVFAGGDPLVPMDDSVPAKLIDPVTGAEVDEVVIPGEGTYTVAPDGTVTFVPEAGFTGKASGVEVVRQDVNGTKAKAKYTPTVQTLTRWIGPDGKPLQADVHGLTFAEPKQFPGYKLEVTTTADGVRIYRYVKIPLAKTGFSGITFLLFGTLLAFVGGALSSTRRKLRNS